MILCQVSIIPIVFRYLGSDMYAAYGLVATMLPWLAVADLGIGTYLQNRVARSLDLEAEIKGEVLASLATTIAVCGALFALIWFAAGSLSGWLLREIPSISRDTGVLAIRAAAALFLVQAIGGACTKLLYSLGRGVLINVVSACSSLTSLLLAYLVASHPRSQMSLTDMLLATYGPASAVALVGLAVTAMICSAKPIAVNLAACVAPWKTSWRFWLISVLSLGVLNIDNFVLSRYADAAALAQYNMLSRVFYAGLSLYIAVLAAYSPSLARLSATEGWLKVRSQILRLAFSGLCGGIAFTLGSLYLFPKYGYFVFGSGAASISSLSLGLFGIYTCVRIWTDTWSTALIASGRTGCFYWVIPLQCGCGALLQISLASRYGAGGVLVAMVASFAGTASWILPVQMRQGLVGRKYVEI
jgi:O-antigen/teichoic acid export membrane protein